MDNEALLRALRFQAWERAKGELQAVLVTYLVNSDKYQRLNKCVEDFVKHVEEHKLTNA